MHAYWPRCVSPSPSAKYRTHFKAICAFGKTSSSRNSDGHFCEFRRNERNVSCTRCTSCNLNEINDPHSVSRNGRKSVTNLSSKHVSTRLCRRWTERRIREKVTQRSIST